LIWPLYSAQVQELLWARYGELSDLQYSCWRVPEGAATCSSCGQCLRIAMTALAAGHNPERMGVDLLKLMSYAPGWSPIASESSSIPNDLVAQRAGSVTAGAIKRTSALRLAIIVLSATPKRSFSRKTWRMLAAYRRLRKRVRDFPHPPTLAVREAFLEWLDPDLRERIAAIYAAYFPLEQRACHSEIFERSRMLTERAISALEIRSAGNAKSVRLSASRH
jgi:hypothetical protein